MTKQRRPPPIQYLAAFEAAARHNSFKSAAKELNVTASAISQQIKSLEEYLNISLFERGARGITLSKEGASFYLVSKQTISTYQTTYAEFIRQFDTHFVRISMIPYIANEIVIPRLHTFSDIHPDINILIETSMAVQDLSGSEIDCALRLGVPPWSGCDHKLISTVSSNLVVSPGYFEKHPTITLDNFDQHTIIHTRPDVNDWQRVKAIFSIDKSPAKELHLDSYGTAIKAAEEGLGVAIGLIPTINKALLSGKLITYSEQNVPIDEGYYLVTKKGMIESPEYLSIYNWVVSIFND
ncbi:hypothetical protein A9Q81_15315 [Gammaproteobacteria bacterium 42_54_T18]|nr:hypothetical protein A9Q81_15315 [Gammaproteobacteria bacterium 42_54_T18]